MNTPTSTPLKPLVDGWLKKIKLAEKEKQKQFGKDAAEAMRFFDGAYANFLYKKKGKDDTSTGMDFVPADEEDGRAPTFQVTINKAAEVVGLFGPSLYQRNPDRLVAPRRVWQPPAEFFGDLQDPMAQQQMFMYQDVSSQERGKDATIASLYQAILDYTPEENDLRRECRLWVDETLIKGASTLWVEGKTSPSGRNGVVTSFDSVDNLGLDPDANRYEDCKYIYRRCCHPVWEVEREYGIAPGTLKGNRESLSGSAEHTDDVSANYKRMQEGSNDELVYYKVYSKMGLGQRLSGVMKGEPEWAEMLETVGDYCFVVVAPGVPYPLNLPPETMPEELADRTQWPIPYWLDEGEWPCEILAFIRKPGQLWPLPYLKSAIGELKFINWVYSFLAGKIRVASRDLLVILKSLEDDVKRAITHGPDYSVIEVTQLHANIDQIVRFIQHPTFNPEIYKVLDRMMEMFDKRTGLTDLIYGQTSTQIRSAEEASVKQSNASIRPDDMAELVEAGSTRVARKEMAAARWLLTDQDVMPIVGTVGAYFWKTLVMESDPAEIFHQFSCKVESGSSKRTNKSQQQGAIQGGMNNVFSFLFQYAQATGDVQPANAMLGAWAKSQGLDAEKYLMRPPPPPPAMPPAGVEPPPGEGAPA